VAPNTVARSLAVGDPSYGELAIGAARMSGGSITALPEELIESSTELLAENSGVLADLAGGVAFGTSSTSCAQGRSSRASESS
jgi:threonine synthase